MNLGERLKRLRTDLGLSQEEIGKLGFISTPGWVKLENSQRSPSDRMILRLISWLIRQNYLDASAAGSLREELLTLKYLRNRSAFVRKLARIHADHLYDGSAILVSEDPAVYGVAPSMPPSTTR